MDTHIMLVFYAKELAPNGVNGMVESMKLSTTYRKKLVLFVSSPLIETCDQFKSSELTFEEPKD